MKKIVYSALFLLVTALTAVTSSQSVRTFTLDEAILTAKQNNSELMIAKMNKLQADAKVSEVYSENLLPTITLNSRYTRSFKKQVIQIFGQTYTLGSDNTITHTLDATEPIPVLGTPVFSGIRIAEYYSRLQEETVKGTDTKITNDVRKAFLNALLSKQVIELNRQSISNAQENLRVVEARYKAGVALEYDFLRAKVKYETLIPALQKSENDYELSKKLLKNAIGLKNNDEIDVRGELKYDSLEIFGNTDELIRNISEKNVAVRQLKLNKLVNEELAEVDYANYMPKLYLFVQYGLQANEDDGKSIFRYRYYNALTAGIGLSWNLNLFSNSYKRDQSLIEIRKSEEQIKDTKEKLKVQSESVLLRLEDARNRIQSQLAIVDEAERGLELANVSFKSGTLNQIDVIDAELVVSQVKLAYIQAIYDYLSARADLEQLLEK